MISKTRSSPCICNAARHVACSPVIVIANPTMAIRQTECSWSKGNGKAIREPFGDEMNAALVALANVGSDVKKVVRGYWLEKQRSNAPAESWSHAVHREGNDAHESATIPQIQLVGNVTLQRTRIH